MPGKEQRFEEITVSTKEIVDLDCVALNVYAFSLVCALSLGPVLHNPPKTTTLDFLHSYFRFLHGLNKRDITYY